MLEQTILIIKPDAVKNKVSGKIIDIIETNLDANILDIRKIKLNRKQVENFYSAHKDKNFYNELVFFMISGPVIILILEGRNVINETRNIIGNTNCKLASVGTIRHKFASGLTENAVHASDSHDSFIKEFDILFKGKE